MIDGVVEYNICPVIITTPVTLENQISRLHAPRKPPRMKLFVDNIRMPVNVLYDSTLVEAKIPSAEDVSCVLPTHCDT